MPLATLSIDLVAQTAKFEADMNRAASVVQGAAARMDRAFAGVGAVFTGTALASAAEEAVRGLVRLYPALIDGVAHFQDLEEQTGASAEALAAFTTAGDVANITADEIAGFMVKLTASLSTAEEGTSKTARALQYLGINMAEFKRLAPEKQFEQLAVRLQALPDGASRTAIAVALLGRSGAQALPFLKELAQTGLSQNRLTAEQIRLADEYADRQARVRSELRQAAQIAAIQTLPAFTALTEELSKAAIATLGLDRAATDLQGNTGVRQFAEGAAVAVATVAESVVGLLKLMRAVGGSFESVVADARLGVAFAGNVQLLNKGGVFNEDNRTELKRALAERNRIAAEANDRYVQLFTESGTKVSDALRFQFSEAGRIAARIQADPRELARRQRPVGPAGRPDRPLPSFGEDGGTKAAREAEQVRKALLDAALRDLEASYASERAAVQFQQQFLDAQLQAGLVTLDAYYSGRTELQRRALDLELERFGAQKAVLEDSLEQTVDASERVKIAAQIDDVIAKASAAGERASEQRQLQALEETRGYQDATARLVEFRAQVLELQGDLTKAAELRANLAIAQARRTSATLGPAGASPADLAAFEEATRAANAFAEAQRNVNRITERQGIEEERIALQARVTGASRVEVEQQLYASRQAALGQLAQELQRVEAIAAAAGPDSPAVQFAQQLRLEFERLQVTMDPALERMRDFGDEVADAFGRAGSAIALNVRDAKSALKSLGDTIQQALARELIERPLADAARGLVRSVTEGQGALGQLARGVFGVGGGGPLGSVIPFNPNAPLPSLGAAVGGAAQAAPAAAFAASLTAASASVAGLSAAETGAAAAIAAASTSSSAALATLASAAASAAAALATVGAGAGAGAASSAFSFLELGFSRGGYTGDGAPTAPAGVVHAGEYVMSAPAVQRLGVAELERLHRYGRAGAPRLGGPGYADGGLVGRRGGVQASGPAHYDFRGAQFGRAGGGDRAAAERDAILNARAIRRETSRHSA